MAFYPPGWYPVTGGRRYWDGRQWTQQVAPDPPKRRGGVILGAVIAVVVGFVALGLVAGEDDDDQGITPSAPTTVKPPITTPAAPSGPTEPELVTLWAAEHGWVFDALVSDLESVGAAGMAANLDLMNRECGTLQKTVNAALALPAIPSSSVEAPWRNALREFQIATDDCVQGSLPPGDADRLNAAAAHTERGNRHLNDATAALADLGG
ncbi:DUF2510 domain-containing protein [Iamia majanohamensis]|uniref:DUF2510 domain-containing protein n=1 Tax=Iamia majanohamensis TaxID=467976 RepID=A0AAE9Y8R4_9ACTN|nr:DUF2510 domain-containing protein [Iamia majanohamensis]WCO68682.1 DUF2510 domain-containing protein [Iamia majanohamensis]